MLLFRWMSEEAAWFGVLKPAIASALASQHGQFWGPFLDAMKRELSEYPFPGRMFSTRDARRPSHLHLDDVQNQALLAQNCGCRCVGLGADPCPRDGRTNTHICQMPHAWSAILLASARGWGEKEASIETCFWEGLAGLNDYVTSQIQGIGQFWGKFVVPDAFALRQALNIPTHVDDPGVADASDAIGLEDTEDCSDCGPGALQDLMWLAPGLKRPMLVLMAIRNAVRKMLCGTTPMQRGAQIYWQWHTAIVWRKVWYQLTRARVAVTALKCNFASTCGNAMQMLASHLRSCCLRPRKCRTLRLRNTWPTCITKRCKKPQRITFMMILHTTGARAIGRCSPGSALSMRETVQQDQERGTLPWANGFGTG